MVNLCKAIPMVNLKTNVVVDLCKAISTENLCKVIHRTNLRKNLMVILCKVISTVNLCQVILLVKLKLPRKLFVTISGIVAFVSHCMLRVPFRSILHLESLTLLPVLPSCKTSSSSSSKHSSPEVTDCAAFIAFLQHSFTCPWTAFNFWNH